MTAHWPIVLALIGLCGCAGPKAERGAEEVADAWDSGGEEPSEDLDGDGHDEDEDCDDTDAAVYPGAPERCDGVDQDCDSEIDVGASDAPRWYRDADGDTYGDVSSDEVACDAPAGYVADPSDCDDARAEVNPSASESCATAWDDDCDGVENEDDASDALSWAPDADGDGFGAADVSPVRACVGPAAWVADASDCDDDDDAIRPTARDVCNDAVDQDCDGSARLCPFAGALTTEASAAVVTGEGFFAQLGAARVADADGDGSPDLLVGSYSDDERAAVFYGLSSARGEVDLTASTWLIEGTGDERNKFGTGVAGGFDLDGDGAGDVLVAAEYDGTSGHAAGRIDLFRGPVTGGIDDTQAYATFYAEAEIDRLSRILDGADLNGDGFDDLICGTTFSGDYNGAVYITWGPIPPGDLLATDSDVRLRGETGAYFGADATTADIDEDGYTDLAVGAIRDFAYDGSVHLYSGASLAVAAAAETAADAYIFGDRGDFGSSVDLRGDADGSGRPDLLVSSPNWGSGFDIPGRTYVFTDVALVDTDYTLADVTLTGEGSDTYSGAARWVGDVNADGYDEAVIGAGGVGEHGRAFLFYGPISPDLTLHADADAWFDNPTGSTLGGMASAQGPDYMAGDVNGDGFDDFILPDFSIRYGRVWLFHGAAGP